MCKNSSESSSCDPGSICSSNESKPSRPHSNDGIFEYLEERIAVLEGKAAWNKTQHYGLDARIENVERRLEGDGLTKNPTSGQCTRALSNERPCIVKDPRSSKRTGAIFHGWAQVGCSEGSYAAAIVEYRTGVVDYVEADRVKFLDADSYIYPDDVE
jgi:hypothetical protein